MGSRWTDTEEHHLLSLIDQTYLGGQSTRYPMLNFEGIAAVMNKENTENLRVYNASGLETHYRVYIRRKYPTRAALAEGLVASAKTASRIVEVAMERSVQADRWVAEITEKVGDAVKLLNHRSLDLVPWLPLDEATMAAKAAREQFRVAAENAERAINRAKKAVDDAKEPDMSETEGMGASAT